MRMNSALSAKKSFKILSLLMAMTVFVGLFCFPATVSAEEINETNPDLTYAAVNSDLEVRYGVAGYEIEGSLKNASANNGKYELSSNSFCVWDTFDDVSFAYNKFPVADTDSDKFVMEATITDYYPREQLHVDAGAGIMVRTSLDPSAPQAFLHVRPDGRLMIIYRTASGGASTAAYLAYGIKYPLRVRITKDGNKIGFGFQLHDSDKMQTISLKLRIRSGTAIYAGLANYSRNKEVTSTVCFENLTFSGFGTADGAEAPVNPGEEVVDPDKDVVFEEEMEMTDDILLYESFTDKSILKGKEAKNNPIWDAPFDANIITLKEKRDGVEYGNRVWFNDFEEDNYFVGSEKWADYVASIDFMFTAADIASQAAIKLAVRNMKNELYGISNYAAVLSGRNKLSLHYKNNTSNVISDYGNRVAIVDVGDYADGKWHTLSVKVVDNIIKVSLDDSKDLIRYEFKESNGSLSVNPRDLGRGNICVAAYESTVCIDNVTVRAVKDPFGTYTHPKYGTIHYDNYIGGNWNENVPKYISDWIDMGRWYDGLVTQ